MSDFNTPNNSQNGVYSQVPLDANAALLTNQLYSTPLNQADYNQQCMQPQPMTSEEVAQYYQQQALVSQAQQVQFEQQLTSVIENGTQLTQQQALQALQALPSQFIQAPTEAPQFEDSDNVTVDGIEVIKESIVNWSETAKASIWLYQNMTPEQKLAIGIDPKRPVIPLEAHVAKRIANSNLIIATHNYLTTALPILKRGTKHALRTATVAEISNYSFQMLTEAINTEKRTGKTALFALDVTHETLRQLWSVFYDFGLFGELSSGRNYDSLRGIRDFTRINAALDVIGRIIGHRKKLLPRTEKKQAASCWFVKPSLLNLLYKQHLLSRELCYNYRKQGFLLRKTIFKPLKKGR